MGQDGKGRPGTPGSDRPRAQGHCPLSSEPSGPWRLRAGQAEQAAGHQESIWGFFPPPPPSKRPQSKAMDQVRHGHPHA